MLGIRPSYKDDMAASSAELVYGMALKLSGEFFSSSFPNASASKFLQFLRRHIRALKLVPKSRPSCPIFISKSLFRSP
ncbi:hypothetical protein NPIL_355291 [Nephila pilipes]|uniref:Uncharacterized protein n=1 Tax=Nephila pilipes TaxID=299642 RepID=A0A8X6UPC0_NEPPI|nr:hypothetical protein NPIL_355291 [Nephila pilipes]